MHKINAETVFKEMMAAPMGGDINSDHGEYLTVGSHTSKKIHCWDGRRYLLAIVEMPPGCKYDPNTGSPILEKPLSFEEAMEQIPGFKKAAEKIADEDLFAALEQAKVCSDKE